MTLPYQRDCRCLCHQSDLQHYGPCCRPNPVTPTEEADEALVDLKARHAQLLELLEEAPCTCSNPEPHDWPHDPANLLCYRSQVDAVLRPKVSP